MDIGFKEEKKMQLTKNFTLEEFYISETAKAKKIDNTPTPEAVVNITRLCDNVIQKIREHFRQPVLISSGFRCIRLNTAIGGASSSQHIKGQAVDFVVKGFSVEQVFEWCKHNLRYDQLIQEKGQWVHISFNINSNRQEALRFDGVRYVKV